MCAAGHCGASIGLRLKDGEVSRHRWGGDYSRAVEAVSSGLVGCESICRLSAVEHACVLLFDSL